MVLNFPFHQISSGFFQPCNVNAFVPYKFILQTNCRKVNAFEKEMSFMGPCNNQRMRNNKGFSQKQRPKDRSSARHSPSKFYSNPSYGGGKCGLPNGNQKGRAFSTHSQDNGENPSNFYTKR